MQEVSLCISSSSICFCKSSVSSSVSQPIRVTIIMDPSRLTSTRPSGYFAKSDIDPPQLPVRAALNGWRPGAGGFHRSGSQGATANGGTWRRGGATAWQNGESFAHKSGFSGTSAAGGSLNRQGQMQYQNGVGGSASRGFNAATTNGASASGYKTNNYDATTGQGTSAKGRDVNTVNGESYGYDASTTYTKGQGFTTSLDTQNKGDYTIDYSKGSKPVVTPSVPPQ